MENYSVLMSVYSKEHPAYLRQAVDSMLNQTVPPSDLVLVCDGPLSPELDAVIEELTGEMGSVLQVIRLPENRGLGISLDVGLRRCKYELVARMDTDDISLPDRMEKQLKFLEAHDEISVVGGQIAEFRGTPENIIDYRKVPEDPEAIRHRVKRRNPMNHMTVVMRKSRVLAEGGYQEITFFEDYCLWTRMLAGGHQMANIGDTCCYVRVDDRLYSRRGGWAYFGNTIKVEKLLLEKKLITWPEYLQNLLIRFGGVVLLPNRLRGLLYKIMLRKHSLSEGK